MRRRVVREVGTVAGVVAIIIALALANGFMRRSSLAEQKIAERQAYEKLQEEQGVKLLKWNILQETTGGYRSGPTFDERLKPYHKQNVTIMGFQVPVEQFRDMTEFIILPMPIECYFCERPPMKDVVLVQMAKGETAPLVEEPVVINGTMELHEGANVSFFYTIKDAKWGPGTPDKKINRRNVSAQHQMEAAGQNAPKEEMVPGREVPQADSIEAIIENAGKSVAPEAPGAPTDGVTAPAPVTDGPVTPPAEPAAAAPAVPAPETTPVPPPQ